ncbi:hypothetical protein [Muricoccus aerilatus]|uniref:hypothetical protein n=1 Tax=Muricoccus aerilatus TaxID=452982 RepID=UPI0005C212E0|nr:hypothetical protein [Roseomonas aerilata]
MRDAASAAAQSDPTQNRWFSRRWQDWATLYPVPQPSMPEPPEPNEPLEVTGHALLLAWREERARQGGAP